VSVVQLYAGAFLPGIMLAGLYIGYVVLLATFRPDLMPPLPRASAVWRSRPWRNDSRSAAATRWSVFGARWSAAPTLGPATAVLGQLVVTLLPALAIVAVIGTVYQLATSPKIEASTAGLVQAGGEFAADVKEESTGLIGAAEPEEAPADASQPATEAAGALSPPPGAEDAKPAVAKDAPEVAKAAAAAAERLPVPTWAWILFGCAIAALAVLYWLWSWSGSRCSRCC